MFDNATFLLFFVADSSELLSVSSCCCMVTPSVESTRVFLLLCGAIYGTILQVWAFPTLETWIAVRVLDYLPYALCICAQLIVLVLSILLGGLCWRRLVSSCTIRSPRISFLHVSFPLPSCWWGKDGEALLMALSCPATPLCDTCVGTYVIMSTLTGGT